MATEWVGRYQQDHLSKEQGLQKTKVQLLWDILSYQQVPKAQALKFRVGYSF